MFATLTEKAHTTGSLTRKLAARMLDGGDCHPAFMFNVFQPIAPHAFPDWQRTYDMFAGLGASDIVLSGAGPSMFAIAPSKEIATAWALVMKARVDCDAFGCRIGTKNRSRPDALDLMTPALDILAGMLVGTLMGLIASAHAAILLTYRPPRLLQERLENGQGGSAVTVVIFGLVVVWTIFGVMAALVADAMIANGR